MRVNRTPLRTKIAVFVLLSVFPATLSASGHGPVFGGATPTLGKGGWSFDQAWMGRRDRTGDSDQILRSMIGYGITEDLQITASLPIELTSTGRMPMGRMTALMSGNRDMEALVGWRFHRNVTGEGTRFESTMYAGATLPLESRRAGIRTAPSMYIAAASGYASRAHYFWVGGGYQRSADDDGDRLGDVASYSVVYGYRPPALRRDYPEPDLRFFVEVVGEVTDRASHEGVAMPDTGGHILLVGPTTLFLYKEYGVSGGMLFPVYQRPNGAQPRERFRFGVNFSYFFWLH
jgi:hypothetical protein